MNGSSLAEIFFDILGPVVVVVAIGVGVGRWLHLAPEPLAKLAYWVIGPAFIFDSLAHAGLATDALARVAAASLLALVASAAFAMLVTVGTPRPRRAAVLTTGVWGNVGNFGLAIVVFTFDESALPYAAVALVTVNTTGLLIGVMSAKSGLAGVARAVTSPLTVFVIPALIVNARGTSIPPVIDRPVSLLAGAIIPVMLITLGIQLQQMGLPSIDLDVAKSLVAKLLVQPLAAIPIVALLDLSDLAAGAVVLQAAMPAAVFTSVLAIEHDTRPNETATIVLAGTLGSMATLPWFIHGVS